MATKYCFQSTKSSSVDLSIFGFSILDRTPFIRQDLQDFRVSSTFFILSILSVRYFRFSIFLRGPLRGLGGEKLFLILSHSLRSGFEFLVWFLVRALCVIRGSKNGLLFLVPSLGFPSASICAICG